ncbi:hypothetical protein VL20_4463 [Microcystis panniformis FACHB-1757]|uniref:Uncharacterized protein n=1 Tax=Microcystis panniformis FACHB-1757 TaxID=1638788 RepID=A0A0K1S5W1_9CHRO|nr:hypothetical protein VL20_4463 [Microcystis panniformis FACHB-1757]
MAARDYTRVCGKKFFGGGRVWGRKPLSSAVVKIFSSGLTC